MKRHADASGQRHNGGVFSALKTMISISNTGDVLTKVRITETLGW